MADNLNSFEVIDEDEIQIQFEGDQQRDSIKTIKILYCLQGKRDIWIVGPKFPYLSISGKALNKHFYDEQKSVVLTSNFIIQNIQSHDAGRIMAILIDLL